MNKKITIIILIIIIIALAGLGLFLGFRFLKTTENSQNTTNNQGENTTMESKVSSSTDPSSKTAVIYFSATGNTESIAKYIADSTKSELIKIIPTEFYTDEDLAYSNDNSRANIEQNDPAARPAIANNINTEDFDTIFLGYPIWWNDVPKIILTFLDSHDLNGKTIFPFCTSGGSSISNSLSTLQNYAPDLNWQSGNCFSSSSSASSIANWLDSLSL